jgi:hypothetical protein
MKMTREYFWFLAKMRLGFGIYYAGLTYMFFAFQHFMPDAQFDPEKMDRWRIALTIWGFVIGVALNPWYSWWALEWVMGGTMVIPFVLFWVAFTVEWAQTDNLVWHFIWLENFMLILPGFEVVPVFWTGC